ncbi:MAG: hypothetical protein MJ238_04820 [Bacilli bacterium]|nr:hypothetical protein [Bacilli bacterium]
MQTRVEKWKRYRAQIKNLPEDKFPVHHKGAVRIQSPDDEEVILSATSASTIQSNNPKKNTVYSRYLIKQRNYVIVKFAVLGVLIIAAIIIYFTLVKGA